MPYKFLTICTLLTQSYIFATDSLTLYIACSLFWLLFGADSW